jgi:ribonuclease VapC
MGRRLDQSLAEIQALEIPFARSHLSIFFDAFRRYGKGRHPAHLNMGDCFTYAVAKVAGMRVLYVGEDSAEPIWIGIGRPRVESRDNLSG